MTMSCWMPCCLGVADPGRCWQSRWNTNARPATTSPGCGYEFAADLAAPGAESSKVLCAQARLLDGRDVLPGPRSRPDGTDDARHRRREARRSSPQSRTCSIWGTQPFASATAFRRSHTLPPSEMKSLYGSITRQGSKLLVVCRFHHGLSLGGHLAISTSGFPFSTTYVASSAPLPLPTFFAAWTFRPG